MADFRIRLNTEIDDGKARQQLNDLIDDYKGKPIKIEIDTEAKDLKDVLTDLKKIKEEAENIKIGGKDGGTSTKMSNDMAEYKRLINQYNQLQKQLSKETNPKSIELLEGKMKDVGSSIDSTYKKLSKLEQGFADTFKADSVSKLETALSKTFSSIEAKADTIGQKLENAFNNPNIDMGALDKLEEKYISIQNAIKDFDFSELSGEELNRFSVNLEELSNELKTLENTANQVKLDNKFDIDCTKSINELVQLREEYEKLGKDTSHIDAMINSMRELQSAVNSVELGTLRNEFNQITNETNQMKNSLTNIKSVMSGTFSDFASSLSAFTIGNVLGDAITSGIYSLKEEVFNLDEAMTNVIKVANETDVNSAEKLQSITENSIKIAKEVAGSVSGVTNSVAEAIKLGFSDMEVAQEIAKFSQIFANVGDMNVEDATKGIATMLNAFQIDPLEKFKVSVNGVTTETTGLEKAMDALNHAGNTQAIDMNGLTSAFQAGGSVLATYGMSLEETVALITSANNSIQDPTRVGNGLKSIAMNFAGLTTSAKDGSIQTNKTAKSLKEIAGIDIYADKKTGQIKSMTELLGELQDKWKDLTEEEQMALSNAVAGRQRVIYSL